MSDFDFSDNAKRLVDAYKRMSESPIISGYNSPIESIVTQLQTTYDNEVLRAVQSVGINVDKDELIKALDYDRKQYEQGYRNGYDRGYAQAKEDIANMLSGGVI